MMMMMMMIMPIRDSKGWDMRFAEGGTIDFTAFLSEKRIDGSVYEPIRQGKIRQKAS